MGKIELTPELLDKIRKQEPKEKIGYRKMTEREKELISDSTEYKEPEYFFQYLELRDELDEKFAKKYGYDIVLTKEE